MAFEDHSLEMARRLKKLREDMGLSHVGLAEKIKEKYRVSISKDSLMNYETSEKFHKKAYSNNGMKVEYLRCLADFYGVSTDYLLGLADDPTPDPTVQSVTSYTGLSGVAVKNLHSLEVGSIQHSFSTRFIDDLLSDSKTISIIADCLRKYVYAKKLATTQSLSLANRDKQSDNLPEYEDGKYTLPASDAANLYYGKAITEAQRSIESIIGQMAGEMLRPYHLSKPNLTEINNFRWKVYSEE